MRGEGMDSGSAGVLPNLASVIPALNAARH